MSEEEQAQLVRLLNNLGGAWDALNEDPADLWRAKRLLIFAGACGRNLLPEGEMVGQSLLFDDAVRTDLKVPYHSPQECPKCRPTTPSHFSGSDGACNTAPQSTLAHGREGQAPMDSPEDVSGVLSNLPSEQVAVGMAPQSCGDAGTETAQAKTERGEA